MIELHDFISEAVVSIVRGIKKGQADTEVGDHVAPLIQGVNRNEYGNFHLKNDKRNQATIIEFDVLVTTEVEREVEAHKKGKVRLYVVALEIDGGGKFVNKSSGEHRLKFSIPVKIPCPNAARVSNV